MKNFFNTAAAYSGIKGLIVSVHDLINVLIGIIASLALLFFVWGLAKFIMHANGDEDAVSEGREFMKWGIIALFVMVSIWGIVNFLIDASGIDTRVGPSSLPAPSSQSNPIYGQTT